MEAETTLVQSPHLVIIIIIIIICLYILFTDSKKRHAVAFFRIMKNLRQCIKINVEFKIALVILP